MNKVTLKKSWVGPLTAATFVLVAASGVAMFFHAHRTVPGLKGLHEWLGMCFALSALLHAALNWRALLGYFKGGPAAWCVLAAVLAAGATMMVFGAAGGGEPHGPRGPQGWEVVSDSAVAPGHGAAGGNRLRRGVQ